MMAISSPWRRSPPTQCSATRVIRLIYMNWIHEEEAKREKRDHQCRCTNNHRCLARAWEERNNNSITALRMEWPHDCFCSLPHAQILACRICCTIMECIAGCTRGENVANEKEQMSTNQPNPWTVCREICKQVFCWNLPHFGAARRKHNDWWLWCFHLLLLLQNANAPAVVKKTDAFYKLAHFW